jgi:hypothetical protein
MSPKKGPELESGFPFGPWRTPAHGPAPFVEKKNGPR